MNDAKTTTKDLIAQMSTLGEILKMMPGAPVTDDVLREAVARMQPGQKIGAVLLSMRVITDEQLARALELQRQMRDVRDINQLDAFFAEVRADLARVCDRVFAAIPPTNPGEPK